MTPGDRVRFRFGSEARSDFQRPESMPVDGTYTVDEVHRIEKRDYTKVYVRCVGHTAWFPENALEVSDGTK